MSGAPATRQRRSKKVVKKTRPEKSATGKGAATKAPKTSGARGDVRSARKPVPAPPKGKQVDAGDSAARPRPKTRSAPPPVDLEVDPDVLEFIKAIDDYRAAHDRPFPTWSEVLYVLKGLGYRRQR
ncbi:MAG: hypothetical protein R3F56_25905 [Planctomycetota bacterium]